jgi:hypothetical protein
MAADDDKLWPHVSCCCLKEMMVTRLCGCGTFCVSITDHDTCFLHVCCCCLAVALCKRRRR